MVLPRNLISLVSLLLLAGCFLGESQHGDPADVDVDVTFVATDGGPLAGRSVFVAETIGMQALVTERLQADSAGTVRLVGRYCTPLIVGIDGGYALIRRDALQRRYSVTVARDGIPSFAKVFGTLSADAAALQRSSFYRHCGPGPLA